MKRRIFLAFGSASLLGGTAYAQDKGSVDKLVVANLAYDRALIAADAKALEGIYTEDFTYIGDHAEVRDKTSQIRFMTDGTVQLLHAESDEVTVTLLGQDHALVVGRFRGRYSAATQEADFFERYTSVWVRMDGRWRLRHEHSSLAPSIVPVN